MTLCLVELMLRIADRPLRCRVSVKAVFAVFVADRVRGGRGAALLRMYARLYVRVQVGRVGRLVNWVTVVVVEVVIVVVVVVVVVAAVVVMMIPPSLRKGLYQEIP